MKEAILDSTSARAANLVGEAFQRQAQHAEAKTWFSKAVKLEPNSYQYLMNLADAIRSLGDSSKSAKLYLQALSKEPLSTTLLTRIASLYLLHLNDPSSAKQYYLKAATLSRLDLDSALELSRCYLLEHTWSESWRRFCSDLQRPGQMTFYMEAFTLALLVEGRYDDMRECCGQLLAYEPENSIALFSLAEAADDEHNFTLALEHHKRALRLHPDNPRISISYLRHLARLGQFDVARSYYRGLSNRSLGSQTCDDKPAWDGSPLTGKTILLDARLGFGDVIQVVRYAPFLEQLGGTVLFQTHKSICSLIDRAEGVTRTIAFHENCYAYDYVFNPNLLWLLLDLPLEARRTPYLSVAEAQRTDWKSKLQLSSRTLNVGVCWQSSSNLSYSNPYTQKSMAFRELMPLTTVPGLTLYSLQKGVSPTDLNYPTAALPLLDFTADIDDFMDTAAIIAELDVIVTVDTCIAHLAGAIGKPTLVLLSHSAGWLWFLNKAESPWYPTVRLYRQLTPGGWSQPVWQVARELDRKYKEKVRRQ
jgi:tetratricopeptide (TPR) repeat protein